MQGAPSPAPHLFPGRATRRVSSSRHRRPDPIRLASADGPASGEAALPFVLLVTGHGTTDDYSARVRCAPTGPPDRSAGNRDIPVGGSTHTSGRRGGRRESSTRCTDTCWHDGGIQFRGSGSRPGPTALRVRGQPYPQRDNRRRTGAFGYRRRRAERLRKSTPLSIVSGLSRPSGGIVERYVRPTASRWLPCSSASRGCLG